MSSVFFLFLLHLALGLLAMLPFVPDRAGTKFFKFCSAAAVFMTTAGLWLLYRRFGVEGGPAVLGDYRVTFGAAAPSLLFAILYNRAQHFAWRAARTPLLGASLAAGVASMVSALAPGNRLRVSNSPTSPTVCSSRATARFGLAPMPALSAGMAPS